jgi:hypothetical protein
MGDSLVRQMHDLFVDVFFENATVQSGCSLDHHQAWCRPGEVEGTAADAWCIAEARPGEGWLGAGDGAADQGRACGPGTVQFTHAPTVDDLTARARRGDRGGAAAGTLVVGSGLHHLRWNGGPAAPGQAEVLAAYTGKLAAALRRLVMQPHRPRVFFLEYSGAHFPTATGEYGGPLLLDGAALPPGWEKRVDPDNEQVYYLDTINKRTKFDAPSEAARKCSHTVQDWALQRGLV